MEKLKIELSKSILDIRLTDLGDDFWSTRTINIFRNNTIITLGDLCDYSENQFLGLRNVGNKKGPVIKEIKQNLKKLGFCLRNK